MKRILTILAATLLLTAAMAGTASASSYDSVAEELSAIGVFRGTAGGFELDRAPTRSEGRHHAGAALRRRGRGQSRL